MSRLDSLSNNALLFELRQLIGTADPEGLVKRGRRALKADEARRAVSIMQCLDTGLSQQGGDLPVAWNFKRREPFIDLPDIERQIVRQALRQSLRSELRMFEKLPSDPDLDVLEEEIEQLLTIMRLIRQVGDSLPDDDSGESSDDVIKDNFFDED